MYKTRKSLLGLFIVSVVVLILASAAIFNSKVFGDVASDTIKVYDNEAVTLTANELTNPNSTEYVWEAFMPNVNNASGGGGQ